MNVTIIADASWCPDTKAAGYGYWIACQRGRRNGGGTIRRQVSTSQVAEMMAVVNGIWHGMVEGYIVRGDVLLVQTDCQNAINLFRAGDRGTTEEREVLAFLGKLVQANELTLNLRHVKGHTSGDTPRTYVNNVCDKVAKKHMRGMRHHLRCNELRQLLTKTTEQGLTQ